MGAHRPLCVAVLVALAALVSPERALALSEAGLRRVLARETGRLGPSAGALVVDLASGRPLYARRPDLTLAPASNQKLYTTATALLRFGPDARLPTALRVRTGTEIDGHGVLRGDLYLVGGGDPTLGDAGLGRLADELVDTYAVARIAGGVVGDGSVFDARRGSFDTHFAPDGDIGGYLGGLTWGHGSARPGGPARVAAARLQALLRARHVRTSRAARTGRVAAAGTSGQALATTRSDPMQTLIAQTNRPSDNFYAETLLKDLGASFGAAGTTPAGVAVMRAQLASLGVTPTLVDGSGLSRADRTSARQLTGLLRAMDESAAAAPFLASLPVMGRSGTLVHRDRRTAAAGRCSAKTGTLRGVSALSGICTTTGGARLAFSLLENRVYAPAAKAVEDRIAAALARYAP